MMKDLEFERNNPILCALADWVFAFGVLFVIGFCLISGHGRAIVLDILFYGFLAYVFYWLYTRGDF